ncbi:basic leucine zipper transcriptional factor ATF-like 2 isoform X2 [Pipistrellus kuhlii]|uniref:basic leucine zipper transcriptional factor ATF-like 2 isoform X2 n=1 Tax=Pipistrellus kuhlii TaxID=59472 RepID=UPI001E270FE2|nr:basic leucine zipper transcriptional factor ATF-like 2 isoform X2 [Pipistrellus kuhlii]
MHLCAGEGLLTGTDPEGQQRQLKKQKNRASAQRSRRKHTDKADALHQHESLERHNRALRKEIQDLREELEWLGRTLHMHERLCLMGSASCSAPLPPGCWGQAGRPLGPEPPRQHGCREFVLQPPASSPPAQQLSPHPQPGASPGPLLCPPPWPSPSPSPLAPSSKLRVPLPHSSAQPAPHQPPGPERLGRGKLVPSPLRPSAALGLARLQDTEHKPAFSAADPPGLQAFPLLSSAQVHFCPGP